MELHDGEAQVHAPTPEAGLSLQEEEDMGEKTQPLLVSGSSPSWISHH